MTYAVTSSHGTQLKIGDGASPEVFTAIKGISAGPRLARACEIIQRRFHSSTSTWKKPTVLNNGPVTFSIQWDESDTQHALLRTSFEAMTRKNFQLVTTHSTPKTLSFSGYIANLGPSMEPDATNELEVSIEIDGDITVS